MRVIVVKSEEEMGKRAAELIMKDMADQTQYVLGLATGSTPLPLYRELIRLHQVGRIDFSKVVTFNVDEYVGLEPTHEQSYHSSMNENLFNHINIKKKNAYLPNGMAENLEEECWKYETLIREAGGIDYQILGIGRNGHIGFNEPGSSLGGRTKVTRLAESTIRDNVRFFQRIEDVPSKAITMGVGTILEARKIILLASGQAKAEAVAKALEGPVTAMVPASALQLHPYATFIITQGAASKLCLQDEIWSRRIK